MKKSISVAFAVVLASTVCTSAAFAGNATPVDGDFTVTPDLSSFDLTPVGANCLLEVEVTLAFTGTLAGMAAGTTRALVLGSCTEVGTNPPGTFRDAFRADLEFMGTLAGDPVMADIAYRGITEVGGTIKAHLQLSDGAKGLLKVDAMVAVSGTYRGYLVARQ